MAKPKLTDEQKQNAIKRVLKGKENKKDIANSVGVAPQTLTKWVKNYQFQQRPVLVKDYLKYKKKFLSKWRKFKKNIFKPTKLKVLIIALIILSIYLISLKIINEFNKENQQPIKIFSSSLNLYNKQKISLKTLQNYLLELGYVEKNQAITPRTFAIKTQQLTVYIAAYKTPTGVYSDKKISFYFKQGILTTILNHQNNSSIAFIALPPVKLTSLHSGVYTDFEPIALKNVPTTFINTLLLVEDKRFYQHIGFDIFGIARAMWANIKAGRVVQGASTITQQYVKTRYLNNQRSVTRKLKELFISIVLELNFTKNQILEAYINSVFLGQKGNYRIRGFNLASYYFFGKSLKDINIAEIASLVALVKAPSSYVIKQNNKKALKRRNLILNVLYQNNKIDKKLLTIAKNYPLQAKQYQTGRSIFSSYIGLVKNELKKSNQTLNWQDNNREIYTNLEITTQIALQKIVKTTLQKLEKNKGYKTNTLEAAAIIIDKNNGNIVAAVANKNDRRFGWNRLLYMKRPIGSLIKPFIYYTALEQLGYTPQTLINDVPISLKIKPGVTWRPKNYDKKSHGNVTLTKALSKSYNLATVNLGLKVGVKQVINTLKKAGYQHALPNYASLFLGATEMSPLEITQLYLPIANDGFSSPLRTLKKATQQGKVKLNNTFVSHSVLKIQPVIKLNTMLKQVVSSGTARSLNWRLKRKPINVAGKTGTSNQLKDSWFIGYDNKYLVTVWLGRDDNKPSGYSGSSGALVIYAAIKNYLDSK